MTAIAPMSVTLEADGRKFTMELADESSPKGKAKGKDAAKQ